MRPDTKQAIHYGVDFIFAPPPNLNTGVALAFQQRLAEPEIGVTFDQMQVQKAPTGQPMGYVFVRQSPALQVTIAQPGPPVGQLLIVASNPSKLEQDFITDAEAVVRAFRETWPGPLQVLRRDCTIRNLYAVNAPHAFQYLWAQRLHQSEDAIQEFGRPILGGGLRFVMPPRPDVPNDPTLEVKIESLLRDPRQLFVETQAVWEAPLPADEEPNPRQLLETVVEYADGPVVKFITRGS